MGQFEDILAKGYEDLSKGTGMKRAAPSRNPTPEPSLRIEEEAHNLVFGDRQAAYGHPSSDFTAMGRITAAVLSRWLESEGFIVLPREAVISQNYEDWTDAPVAMPDIAPQIVALIMTAVKLSRQSAQPKRDNLVDLIGYTLCADRIIEGEDGS